LPFIDSVTDWSTDRFICFFLNRVMPMNQILLNVLLITSSSG